MASDTVPAMLTPGEYVVPRDCLTPQLRHPGWQVDCGSFMLLIEPTALA